jgi:hypothetical protein
MTPKPSGPTNPGIPESILPGSKAKPENVPPNALPLARVNVNVAVRVACQRVLNLYMIGFPVCFDYSCVSDGAMVSRWVELNIR